jgi:hypothetical protein
VKTNKINTRKIEEQLEKKYKVINKDYASTGTTYITIAEKYGNGIVVRIADHGECYCREDLSIDPYGLSYKDACKEIDTIGGLRKERKAKSKSEIWLPLAKGIAKKRFGRGKGKYYRIDNDYNVIEEIKKEDAQQAVKEAMRAYNQDS